MSDAAKYHPERYLNQTEVDKTPKQINIPFGLGKRNCLGKELAWNEVMIYIGALLNWYEVKTPKDYSRKMTLMFGYRCINPYVDVKLRVK